MSNENTDDHYDRIAFEAFVSNGVEMSRKCIYSDRTQTGSDYHNGHIADMWEAWKMAFDRALKRNQAAA